MGRGAQTAADQFSQVLGDKRGSRVAQMERDEIESDVASHLRGESREQTVSSIRGGAKLQTSIFEPLLYQLQSPNKRTRAWAKKEFLDMIRENLMEGGSFEDIAEMLGHPNEELPKCVRQLLLEVLISDQQGSASRYDRCRSHRSLLSSTFTGKRPLRDVKQDAPLIASLAELYRGKISASSPYWHLLLVECLVRQPVRHLPTFEPWFAMLCEEIVIDNISSKELSAIARAIEDLTPAQERHFERLREARREVQRAQRFKRRSTATRR